VVRRIVLHRRIVAEIEVVVVGVRGVVAGGVLVDAEAAADTEAMAVVVVEDTKG
jgi:hypothetical protein